VSRRSTSVRLHPFPSGKVARRKLFSALTDGGLLIGWAGGVLADGTGLRHLRHKYIFNCNTFLRSLRFKSRRSTSVRFTQRPPMGDSKRKLAGGTTHLNYPYLASPFGRGVLRKQDGEGVLLMAAGGLLIKTIQNKAFPFLWGRLLITRIRNFVARTTKFVTPIIELVA